MSSFKGDKQIVFAVLAVSVLFIVGSFVAVLAVTGEITSKSTPYIASILSLAGVMIPAFVAMIRSVENRQMIRDVNEKVDGHLTVLTTAAINAGVKPEDLPPLPPSITGEKDANP